jgi:hypothetical protein
MPSLIYFDRSDIRRECISRSVAKTCVSIEPFTLKFFPDHLKYVPNMDDMSGFGHALTRLKLWNNSPEEH